MQTKLLIIKRLMSGLSKEDLAKELNICRTSYNNKELGRINFTQNEIKKLIDLLDLSNDEVVEIFFTDDIEEKGE